MTDSDIAATVTSDGPGQPTTGSLKSDTVGTTHIVAMVVASAAPIGAAVSLIPLGILLGNGLGTPGAIVLVALTLAIFAIGYVRILPHIRNTGAFYAYITAGLGRPVGLASAYVLSLSYIVCGASLVGGFSFFAKEAAEQYFHLDIPWIFIGIIGIAAAAALAICGVAVTARVLFVILALELLALLVVDAMILFHNEFPAFTLSVFKPSHIFSGSVGVAAIYALALFMGFEGTAIYTEEAKDPQRTVPRATFWIIGFIGAFYTISAWAMVAGTGADNLVPTVGQDPGGFVFGLSDQYVGHVWTHIITLLNLFSLFAGIIAFQNAGARYMYALARDGMLPRIFGRTHAKHSTPWVGLTVISIIFALLSITYAAGGLDPLLEMATSLVGLGTIGLLTMLTVVSLSIGVFFVRRGNRGVTTVVAPFVATLLLGYCTAAGVRNYDSITGVKTWWINNLSWLLVPVFILGLGYALWVRQNRKQAYDCIGKTHV
ncbi:APC family permease [Streptomyces violaceusniger]|uniref:APC family permease n=1 Tax=Streptomyces violaceusniger TaxID=68280 RepID=UPI0034226567